LTPVPEAIFVFQIFTQQSAAADSNTDELSTCSSMRSSDQQSQRNKSKAWFLEALSDIIEACLIASSFIQLSGNPLSRIAQLFSCGALLKQGSQRHSRPWHPYLEKPMPFGCTDIPAAGSFSWRIPH
jgi:hypothetical protein